MERVVFVIRFKAWVEFDFRDIFHGRTINFLKDLFQSILGKSFRIADVSFQRDKNAIIGERTVYINLARCLLFLFFKNRVYFIDIRFFDGIRKTVRKEQHRETATSDNINLFISYFLKTTRQV